MAAPRLSVTDTNGQRVVSIEAFPFSVGRRATAHLQVAGGDISRDHAEIVSDGRVYLLRDVGSRFGTFLNGVALSAPSPLAHGDRIRLGVRHDVELTFLVDDEQTSSFITGGAHASSFQQMAAILNGLRALGSGRVLDEVLTLVLDSAIEVTRAERGFIMLADAGRQLQFRVAREKGRRSLTGTSFTTSAKIPREVFETGRSLIVSDLLDDGMAGIHDGTVALGIRHVLCVPLTVASHGGSGASPEMSVIGVLHLDGRERGTLLSPETQSSLEAFATQAALAIDSARLYAEAAEKARLDRDLRMAAEIQRALLPPASARGPYFWLAAASIPCRTIGGDFFDYLDLGDLGLSFVLGDVSGKGPPAALLAATVQSNYAALAQIGDGPGATVTAINRALLRRAIEARFTTLFHGVLSPQGRLSYCNAGHEPPLVVRRHGQTEWLTAGGPVVGLFAHVPYDAATVVLEPGDLVVIFSDGVTEARNGNGDEYGRDRVLAAVAARHGTEPALVLEALAESVTRFSGGVAQTDDLTGLVLRFA